MRELSRLLEQNDACKNSYYEDDYEFVMDFLTLVKMVKLCIEYETTSNYKYNTNRGEECF